MAMLRGKIRGERRWLLPERTRVGRGRDCDIRLNARESSGEHALIRWSDQRWRLRDLGSRNGTWVTTERLELGEETELRPGMTISFGCAEETWEVVDVEPPCLFARSATRDVLCDKGMLVLPDRERPLVTIHRNGAGEWICESGTVPRSIVDREQIEVGGERWQVHIPATLAPTRTGAPGLRDLSEASLLLTCSLDQEYITAELRFADGASIDLEARAHHALLLELARVVLDDRQAGLDCNEVGWVGRNELAAKLGLDSVQHLNVFINRLRQQLSDCAIANARSIIEARRRTGNVRLGLSRVEIRGGIPPRYLP